MSISHINVKVVKYWNSFHREVAESLFLMILET